MSYLNPPIYTHYPRREGPPPHNPCGFCRDELPLAPLIELRYGSQRFRFCRLACLVAWCETDPAALKAMTGKAT